MSDVSWESPSGLSLRERCLLALLEVEELGRIRFRIGMVNFRQCQVWGDSLDNLTAIGNAHICYFKEEVNIRHIACNPYHINDN